MTTVFLVTTPWDSDGSQRKTVCANDAIAARVLIEWVRDKVKSEVEEQGEECDFAFALDEYGRCRIDAVEDAIEVLADEYDWRVTIEEVGYER